MNKAAPCGFLWLIVAFYNQFVFAVTCEFSISNEWNSGFTSSVTLHNDTQSIINGWVVSIEFVDGSSISHMWDASLSGHTPYQASNLSYNQTIQPGQSVNFGFNSQKNILNTAAQAPMLGGICIDENGNNAPQAFASASTLQGVIPLTVDFDASQSTDPDADELTYLWQFEDGSTSTEINPTHTFIEAGEQTVILTVDDGELSANTTLSIIAQLPEPESAQCEYIVDQEWGSGFTSTITITNTADQAINSWIASIDFPDHSASITQMWDADFSGQNPYQANNKSYNGRIEPGSTVSFGFNSNKSTQGAAVQTPLLGGICAATEPPTPNNPPQISATVSPNTGTIPLTTEFDASQSSDPDGDELSFYWDFGNGQSSSEAVASQSYTEAGVYTVTLTLTDSHQASATQQFTISAQEPVVNQSYTLDAQSSSLFFVSSKKVHVIETHTFTDISGEISPVGAAQVRVNLDSVDTGIDIRNERMRNVLFETSVFSEATVSLDIDMAMLDAIPIGGVIQQSISPAASLYGVDMILQTQVSITRLSADTLLVQNLTPLLLNVEDFNLAAGVEALRELAGLDVISYSVPVNFTLIFNKQ